jgi:protein tyrosine/serine phosphatase
MSTTSRSYKHEFINFREVCIGGIAPKRLYHSSRPATFSETNFALSKLAEKAEIAAVINLDDREAELVIKADRIPWYRRLFEKGCVIALDMDFNYKSDQFSLKLYKGFKFILEHKGHYLIHCLQGIDRTGFIVMILEMLTEANKKEIINEYMMSFLERPGFEKGSEQYRVEKNNFLKILIEINNFAEISREDDLVNAAENYVSKVIGLTMDETNLLKRALSINNQWRQV